MEELTSLSSSTQNAKASTQLIPRKPVKLEDTTFIERLSRPPSQSPTFDTDQSYHRQQIPQAREMKSHLSIWNKPWTLEILSCLLSGTAFVAIIVTLAVHRGRPLPEWPHWISVNSLISIFTTILKAALIMPVAEGLCQLKWQHFRTSHFIIDLDRYDLASRGPWGSLLFLFKSRKRYRAATPAFKFETDIRNRSLAIIGASITVAALAIDPFSQQVILYSPCSQPRQNAQASVPRINNYTFPALLINRYTSTQEISFTGAIYQGLLNPPSNATSIISFDCTTGNCTFPEDGGATYSSLGICHSFLDLTETVNVTMSGYNLSLPSGQNLFSPNLLSSVVVDDVSTLTTFEIIMFLRDNSTDEDDALSTRYFAFRGSLFPCIRTYAARISNNVLEERVISSVAVPYLIQGLDGEDDGCYGLATNRTLRNGLWHDCKPTFELTADNLVAYAPNFEATDDTFASNTTTQYYPADCIWSINHEPIITASTEFRRLFGNQTWDNSYPTNVPLSLVRLASNMSANVDSVSEYLSGVANTLTANMRQSQGPQPSNYAHGTVYELQTCIYVHWAWLSLPAALFLLTLGFLVLIILRNSHYSAKLPAWKSSEMALLFHGFNHDVLQKYRHLETEEDMSKTARLVQVRLVKNVDQGWTFERVGYGESLTNDESDGYT